MAHKLFLFNFLILAFFFAACNSLEPPPPTEEKPTLNLELEDASCIEAWVKLTTTNLQFPATITLKQSATGGNTVEQTISLLTQDSVIYIDSLLPKVNYNFQASSIQHPVSSNELSVTTLDTTSHNFTWQTFTFGEHGNSVLRDVAIIDENNIWAVGKIFLNDSTGQPDSQPYNAAHWNGNEWEIIRIPTRTFSGTTSSSEIKTMFSFSTNDIWTFSIAGSYSHWNGIEWETEFVDEREGSGLKLWGGNSNNLYLVGTGGSISLYNGTSWQRIESGTNVDFLDVWGSIDGTMWACGYSRNYSITTLLRNSDNDWKKVYEGSGNNQSNGYYIGPISGVWGTGNYRIYMMNWGGIYIQANGNELFLEKEIAKFSDVGFGIDGTDDNNIFVCGEGFVGHWNGISYTEYPELYKDFRTFYSVNVKENTVCAVGSDYNGFIYSQAVIALAK